MSLESYYRKELDCERDRVVELESQLCTIRGAAEDLVRIDIGRMDYHDTRKKLEQALTHTGPCKHEVILTATSEESSKWQTLAGQGVLIERDLRIKEAQQEADNESLRTEIKQANSRCIGCGGKWGECHCAELGTDAEMVMVDDYIKYRLESLRTQLAERDAQLCATKEAAQEIIDKAKANTGAWIGYSKLEQALSHTGPCKHEYQLTAEIDANDKIHAELKEERALVIEREAEIEALNRYKATHENTILEHGTDNCPFCQQDAELASLKAVAKAAWDLISQQHKLKSNREEAYQFAFNNLSWGALGRALMTYKESHGPLTPGEGGE